MYHHMYDPFCGGMIRPEAMSRQYVVTPRKPSRLETHEPRERYSTSSTSSSQLVLAALFLFPGALLSSSSRYDRIAASFRHTLDSFPRAESASAAHTRLETESDWCGHTRDLKIQGSRHLGDEEDRHACSLRMHREMHRPYARCNLAKLWEAMTLGLSLNAARNDTYVVGTILY